MDRHIHIGRVGFYVSVLVIDEEFGLYVVVLTPDFNDVGVRVIVDGDREADGTAVFFQILRLRSAIVNSDR